MDKDLRFFRRARNDFAAMRNWRTVVL